MATKKYINTPDVVKLTGRPSSEIIDLVKSGVLPGHKTKRGWWRYDLEAVEKYFGLTVTPEAKETTAEKKVEKVAVTDSTELSPYKLAMQKIDCI